MTDYFIDIDANNEPTIWRGTRDDPRPYAVVTAAKAAV